MIKDLFVPNAKPRPSVFLTMVVCQVLFLLLLWLFYPLQLFPTLGEVVAAFKDLVTTQGLIQELWASLTTALGALAIATVLALVISYLTALPFFRPIAYAASKMRYLTLTGLTFFMALMVSSGHLDLESRKGKAPGGYNYPLDETGVPFIFMNATSSLRDVVTMLHEGGHAVHSFLTRGLPLGADKHPPSEVAELASMSMELMSMDQWHVFFPNPDDLRRAKKTHLESVLETFPWVATIDKFQHWIYENPTHTEAERHQRWVEVFDEFNQRTVDWRGLEAFKPYLWQKQLHLYEVPFYYIEYAMAQLGAIAVWRNYRQNPAEGLAAYKRALALGYTAPIGQIYAAAGIRFDFSTEYLRTLADFVREEMAAL